MPHRSAAPGDLRFTELGSGPPFAMLHPGGTDSRAMTSFAELFADRFRVLLPDRRGHGRTPDGDGPMTFEGMADDTAAFLDRHAGGPSPLLGYSDGAVVALLVALRRPDLVTHLVLVSGVHARDAWPSDVLDAPVPDFMVDAYAEASPDGRAHHPVVAAKLRAMHEQGPDLGPEDLGRVRVPTLLIVGDDDDMPLEHSLSTYRALPAGELAVVPRASHGVLIEHPGLCGAFVTALLQPERPATLAPIRRAAAG